MARIPQHFIDELMSRVDIVDLIDARVPLRKAGRDYTARCPFHEEKSPSFTVSPTKQFYHCFGCGAHGTALGFLMAYEHMSFGDAVRELAAKMGMEIPHSALAAEDTASHDPLYAILDKAAQYFRQQLRQHAPAVEYLKQRGLSGTTAAEFSIGYAPPGWDNLLREFGKDPKGQALLLEAGLIIKKDKEAGYYDRFRNRIMFPIRDRRGRVVGFGGRVLDKEGSPKYLNSPETPVFHKGRELYGLHEAQRALRRLDTVMVVEGYMDVVALAQHGIRYAVATLGTATTPDHVERLFRLTSDVVFCFDGDRAGRDAARRALDNLLPGMREGRQARFLFLPEGEDPDSLIRKEGQGPFERRIAQSIPLSAFFYEVVLGQADIHTMEGRARLVELAKPGLSKLPTGLLKHMMLIKLAELSRIDADTLARSLGMVNRQSAPTRPDPTPTRPIPVKTALSPLRTGLGLLLQAPRLAEVAGAPRRWEGLDIPGISLLIDLVEMLQEQPNLHSGVVLERWRDTPEGRHLAELAKWDPLLPPEGQEAEFRDIVQWLDNRLAERRREELHAKWQRDGLSPAEKAEFVELQRRCAGGPAAPLPH